MRNSIKGQIGVGGRKGRRNKLEIMVDILSVAIEGAKKTEIVYKANLNFKRAGKYISLLEEKGFIECNGWGFKTTEKGKEFLNNYYKMKRWLI